jgi:hypothetical protein
MRHVTTGGGFSSLSGSIASMWHVIFWIVCLLGLWNLPLPETLQNFINKHTMDLENIQKN